MSEYTITFNRKPIKKTVTNIGLHMFPFTEDFTKIRYKKKDQKCHLCSKEFKEKEWLSVAFVKGHKNHLICEVCASDLVSKGVSYVDTGRKDEKK